MSELRLSANLGAIEIAPWRRTEPSGADSTASAYYYWIGAVPGMVFLGVVMMPFYYGSRVRSVPEYLLRRFDRKTHLVTALIFVVASVLIAGVNLYALAFVLESLLGIPLAVAIIASALFVLSYILLGGLSSAIYNEVMQFFVILLALIPVIIVVLKETGGIHGLFSKLATQGASFTHPWNGTRLGGHNPFGDWIHRLRPGLLPVVRLLDHELRRGPAGHVGQERGLRAADTDRRGLPEGNHPAGHGHPGHGRDLADPRPGYRRRPDVQRRHPGAVQPVPAPRRARGGGDRPAGAFMAGMAANVSSFNAVWTYDIWQNYSPPAARTSTTCG